MTEIKRAACFEGEKIDPLAKCIKEQRCKLAQDCMWTKNPEELKGLGKMPEGRDKMLSST